MSFLVTLAVLAVLIVAALTLVVARRGSDRRLRESVRHLDAQEAEQVMRHRHHIESGQG